MGIGEQKNIDWTPILEGVNKGDPGAYKMLVHLSEKPFFKFCVFYVGRVSCANDLFQDTFLKVIEKNIQFHTNKSPLPFLNTIARNLYLDKIKSPKNSYHLSLEELQSTPEVHMQNEGASRDLIKLLSSLNEKEKFLVISTQIEGYSYREAAKMISITESNAKVIVSRAKKHLQNCIEAKTSEQKAVS